MGEGGHRLTNKSRPVEHVIVSLVVEDRHCFHLSRPRVWLLPTSDINSWFAPMCVTSQPIANLAGSPPTKAQASRMTINLLIS